MSLPSAKRARRGAALGLALAGALVAGGAFGDPQPLRHGDITLADRVVRASIPGSPNTAAYLLIGNSGDHPDALIAARCACAAQVSIHATMTMRGVSMMVQAAPVVIPPHTQVSFHPNGYHLMLTGLKAPLRDGGQQPITLIFKRAGPITANFRISASIASGPPMPGMAH